MGRSISDRMSYRNHYICSGEATSTHEMPRFGDVSDSADTTAKQLTSVTEELDTTKAAMKVQLQKFEGAGRGREECSSCMEDLRMINLIQKLIVILGERP